MVIEGEEAKKQWVVAEDDCCRDQHSMKCETFVGECTQGK